MSTNLLTFTSVIHFTVLCVLLNVFVDGTKE